MKNNLLKAVLLAVVIAVIVLVTLKLHSQDYATVTDGAVAGGITGVLVGVFEKNVGRIFIMPSRASVTNL